MTDAGEELVAVPRSILGAACAAIRKKLHAPNTLAKLNWYAVHGVALSSLEDSKATLADANSIASAPAQAEALPAGVDAVREALATAEPFVELLHSLTGEKRARAIVWKALKQIRAALSSAPAQEGRS